MRRALSIVLLLLFLACCQAERDPAPAQGLTARQAFELALERAQQWDQGAELIYLAVWDPLPDGRDQGPWTIEFAADDRAQVLRVLVNQDGALRADASDLSATALRQPVGDAWIDSDELAALLERRGTDARPGWVALILSADAAWPGEQPGACWRAFFGNNAAGVWYLSGTDGADLGLRELEGF